ncbi:Atu4866 domain-containing protein [Tamaricihabitans halophyticus]|uniref:Atu4866 domain-containing protein n=1 Tax=Tamaricihabitans halophyticus TaxID=1262583 RepID=UPI003C70C164
MAVCLAAFLAAACADNSPERDDTPTMAEASRSEETMNDSATSRSGGSEWAAEHPYVGMWVTADGHIRQELLPDGRYDEARGNRQSAYTGRYWITGDRIEYRDDTGFSADGEFDGDVLHHAGYVFYREGSLAHRRATEGDE